MAEAATVVEAAVTRRFVDDLVGAGATVYGPAVRDMALAIQAGRAFRDAGGAASDFGDPAVLPQHKDRLRGPTEIDAIIAEEDFNAINWNILGVRKMSRARVALANPALWPRDAERCRLVLLYMQESLFHVNRLSHSIHPAARHHYADIIERFAQAMVARSGGARRRITLDLVIVKSREEVTSSGVRPTFDVDGLLLDGRGMWVCDGLTVDLTPVQRHAVFQAVLAAVAARRATPCAGLADERALEDTELMREQGWTVVQ